VALILPFFFASVMEEPMERARAVTTAASLLVIHLVLGSPAFAQVHTQSSIAKPGKSLRSVLVSIPDRQLAVIDNGVILRTFPVSVGAADSPSPTGIFQIVSRVARPVYSHMGTVIAAGPDNPLGPRWMGLSVKGYGIHGTNQPRSIGKAASHGCIRLSNRDIVELYNLLSVGDTVEILADRDPQTAQIFIAERRATLVDAHLVAPANLNHLR
jgi:lipoprotein-anchoring transpeptidase ErfK/SrfK